MHSPDQWPLRKTTISTRNHVVSTHQVRESHNPLRYKFRMFHDIRCMTDHTGDQYSAIRQFGRFPNLPFVFMTRIGGLNGIGPGIYPQNRIDDVFQGNVSHMW